jgi:hypothetical protein
VTGSTQIIWADVALLAIKKKVKIRDFPYASKGVAKEIVKNKLFKDGNLDVEAAATFYLLNLRED